jgi:hypothetical protein
MKTNLEPCRIPAQVPIPIRRPTPNRLALSALVVMLELGAMAFASGVAHASPMLTHADGKLVDVRVLVDGLPAPLYLRPGTWDREYFQAFRGKSYSLQVTNNSGERVAVLMSVDGLNVVTGQASNLSSTEGMYVLSPWSTATISGWRSSLNDVRRFVFVDEEHSYASRTDQANGDMGWIRVLSFREQPQHVTWRDDQRRERSDEGGAKSQAAPAPSAGELRANGTRPPDEGAPGTGWGDRRYDPVSQTEFTAVANPTDQIVLRYEYASGLRALGINIRTPRVWERERGQFGFAQPPRW